MQSWTLQIPIFIVEKKPPFRGFLRRLFDRLFRSRRLLFVRVHVVANTPEEAANRVGEVLTTFSARNMYEVDVPMD